MGVNEFQGSESFSQPTIKKLGVVGWNKAPLDTIE